MRRRPAVGARREVAPSGLDWEAINLYATGIRLARSGSSNRTLNARLVVHDQRY